MLTFNVGITGHRAHVLQQSVVSALEERLDDVFEELNRATAQVQAEYPSIFCDAPAQLRLHTALASGADQLAAASARRQGYQVRALLPFPPEEYARDFLTKEDGELFRQHLESADGLFALPGQRNAEESAYVMVGKAVIAAADLLIAVWDGQKGNGLGGTAHVVELALRAGVPVLHIPIHRDEQDLARTRLLVGGSACEPRFRLIDNAHQYTSLVKDILTPHFEMELGDLSLFLEETEKQTNLRIEYPVLLYLLGVKSLSRGAWHQPSVTESLKARPGADGCRVPRHLLAYEWANFLAIRYAQLFRSGHVTNYMLAALAVLTALSGLLLPQAKSALVVGELCVLALLFLNTRVGRKHAWHRRWLQYRHLAESLRPLGYLKRTGVASPPFRNDSPDASRTNNSDCDWTRWYAAAIWREIQSPTGTLDEVQIRALVDEVQREEIADQTAYHKINEDRMHKLDHRLHIVGEVLMCVVVAACGIYLILDLFHHNLVKTWTNYFVFITAGFPALGAAVFGMRGHGEHLLAARRSASTASALSRSSMRLDQIRTPEELAAELERTAEIMLADLNDWTVAYSERSLQVPG